LELLAKSAFDRLTALIALLMVAPVMLGIAALILLRRDGPVFFSHDRVGRDGRMFRCHKFRTMVPNGARLFDRMLAIDPIASEDWLVRRKVYRDPRVSRLGAFLRSTSLDELPQFWNVLKGDMSMVGPRPITVEELAKYGDNARDYLSVRPGITGAWQVSGRSECTYAERVALDVDYIRNLSFSRDMSILLRTVDVVLRRQGAS
jgi:lipopolysaccharide/colanic/teichoic acid biosynthesis glycosyltransferase